MVGLEIADAPTLGGDSCSGAHSWHWQEIDMKSQVATASRSCRVLCSGSP
jgi:hypothetical protein